MEIVDEKYTDVIKTITESKDALLAAVEKKLQTLTTKDSSADSKAETDVSNE